MTKIIHIQRYSPNPYGNGGTRRIYQNYQDLITIVGMSEVGVFSLTNIDRKKMSLIENYKQEFIERVSCFSQIIKNKCDPTNVQQELMRESIKTRNPFGTVPLKSYCDFIKKYGKPEICVVDYPSLFDITCYNKDNGIVNLYIPQNLESFTQAVSTLDVSNMRIKCARQWLVELEIFYHCHERLLIGISEAEFIRGLGLSALYYPYIPVNEIRTQFLNVRQNRENTEIDKGLFVMVGSLINPPTSEGFRWLLNNIKEFGLPNGVRIVVGGLGGGKLIDEFGIIPGIDFRGWLKQDEFYDLLYKACAILIPQYSGSGAITRISEMSCAGIPMITSDHILSAMDAPPGVMTVPQNWNAWLSAMQTIIQSQKSISLIEYEDWEKAQLNPLKTVIEKYLKKNR